MSEGWEKEGQGKKKMQMFLVTFHEKQLSCLGGFGGCPKMADSVGVRQARAEKRRVYEKFVILC